MNYSRVPSQSSVRLRTLLYIFLVFYNNLRGHALISHLEMRNVKVVVEGDQMEKSGNINTFNDIISGNIFKRLLFTNFKKHKIVVGFIALETMLLVIGLFPKI